MLAIPLRPQMFQGYIKFHASHFALGWLIPFSSCHANKSVVTTQSPHSRHLAICTKLKLNRNDSVRLWWNSFLAIFMSESFIFFFFKYFTYLPSTMTCCFRVTSRGGRCASNHRQLDSWDIHYTDVIMGAMASQITSLTIVYSTAYSGADQRKHQSSASLAFVWGIHQVPVNSPHEWPVTQRMFPFDDVVMYLLRKPQYFWPFFVGKSPVTGWFVTQKANNVARNVSMAWSMTSSRESESFTYFAFFAICRWHDMLTGGKNPALSSCSRKSCKIVDFFFKLNCSTVINTLSATIFRPI